MSHQRLDLSRAMFGSEGDPLGYPGQMPSAPVMLNGSEPIPLEWRAGRLIVAQTGLGVNEALRNVHAPVLEQRVAQIAYGANRNLHNLAWKLRSYAQHEGASRAAIVVPAKLHDADVVACNIGYWGYVYAAALLHRPPALDRPYLSGASVDVALVLLDEHQMRAMHRSEGVPLDAGEPRASVSCDIAVMACHVLGVDVQVRAQAYVLPLPFVSFDEGRTPAPFAAVNRQGGDTLPRFSQVEMWQHVADRLELGDPMSVVRTMQEGAMVRAAGDPGATTATLPLYERIRSMIIERMPLADPDGVIRTGTDGVPGLLSLAEAWEGDLRVGEAIRG